MTIRLVHGFMRTRRSVTIIVSAAAALSGACGGGGKSAEDAAFCKDYKVVGNVDPTDKDPGQLERNIAQFEAAQQRIAEEAPDELKDDAAVLARRFPEFAASVKAAGYDISKVDVDAFFGDAQISKAGGAMDKYAEEHCK